MIVRNVRERRPIRSLAAAGVSAVLLAVACETVPPTTVDAAADGAFAVEEVPSSPETGEAAILAREVPSSAEDAPIAATIRELGVDAPRRLRVSLAPESPGPLIYIDEILVEKEALGDVKPDDIERIEVLKGGAATSLYGAEAAGGVIQVFLKETEERRSPR